MTLEDSPTPPRPASSQGQDSRSSGTVYIYTARGIDTATVKLGAWPPSPNSENSPQSPNDGDVLIYSLKPPAEVAIFGLRGSDIKDIRPEADEKTPISPEEFGFKGPTSDGICKYCQLMLHPEVPDLIEHHANTQDLLISSQTCPVCKRIETSLSYDRSPFQEGNSDKSKPSEPITVGLQKQPRYTRAIGSVGSRRLYTNLGIPLTITTWSRLGDLAARRFWRLNKGWPEENSLKRFDILKGWLNECADHDTCGTSLAPTHNAMLPARILDLTGSLDVPCTLSDVVVKVRDTDEGEMGTYTALSYCWGADPKQQFRTTQDNIRAHMQAIDFRSLPRAHREAILVTIYLGIRYLWIDSLCIVQDSHQDWEVASAEMGSVYSNAHLTLAATTSNSPEEGLVFANKSALYVDIHNETRIIQPETHRTVDDASEPLNTRGWALQEAVLASRMVCFGQNQWLWKCPSRHTTEDGLTDGAPLVNNGLIQWAHLIGKGSIDTKKDYLNYWYQMVTNYSSRSLTYESDKGNAIAGLTNIFTKKTGFRYLAGLWEEDLANGLSWQASARGVVREPTSIASWSWLSVKGRILGCRYKAPPVPMIELLEADQQWEGPPLVSRLEAARLTIRGFLLQATLGKVSVTQESRYSIIAALQSEEIFGEAFLDSKLLDNNEELAVLALFLSSREQDGEYMTLLLTPRENTGDGNEYRRLGIGVLWKTSRFYGESRAGCNVLKKASLNTVVLV